MKVFGSLVLALALSSSHVLPAAALDEPSISATATQNLRRTQEVADIIVVLNDDGESRRRLNQVIGKDNRREINLANKAKAANKAKGLGVAATHAYGMALVSSC